MAKIREIERRVEVMTTLVVNKVNIEEREAYSLDVKIFQFRAAT